MELRLKLEFLFYPDCCDDEHGSHDALVGFVDHGRHLNVVAAVGRVEDEVDDEDDECGDEEDEPGEEARVGGPAVGVENQGVVAVLGALKRKGFKCSANNLQYNA